ncbi:hypothetical protein CHUAL_003898 [Chamberlinius hualienensis]
MAFKIAYIILVLSSSIHYASAAWQLSWTDDFDLPAGSPPDSNKWGYDLGGNGWLNEEREFYTNSTANSQHDGNGFLNIVARDDDAAQYSCWYGPCWYTSARLLTRGRFTQTYGRFEARMKLPKGGGLWPAFWSAGANSDTVGWPDCGEIDVMEMRGSDVTTILGTMHGPGYSGAGGLTENYTLKNGTFSDDFHTFATEWFSDHITWYVDDTAYETRTPADLPEGTTWVFDHPFFIIMNLAVGGPFDGDPDGSYPFPQQVTVDYVHIYTWV